MFSIIFPILFIFITSLHVNLKLDEGTVKANVSEKEKAPVAEKETPTDSFSIFYEVKGYLVEHHAEEEVKAVVNDMISKVKIIAPETPSFSIEMVHELETMIKKDTMNLIYYYCQLDELQKAQSKEKMLNMLHTVNDKLDTRFIQAIKNNHRYDFEKTATLMNER